MDENEFEFLGEIYLSREVDLSNGCKGCSIMTQTHGCAANLFKDGSIPDCDPGYRIDGRNVIFAEKQT